MFPIFFLHLFFPIHFFSLHQSILHDKIIPWYFFFFNTTNLAKQHLFHENYLVSTTFSVTTVTTNKDHQRIMIDPMFMIFKNFRLFVTAVTPTAVTPTAIILWNNFIWFLTILDHFGNKLHHITLFWDHFELFDNTRPY